MSISSNFFRSNLKIVLCGLLLSPYIAIADKQTNGLHAIDQPNAYYRLGFYSEFFSDYLQYPDSNNKQRGSIHINRSESANTIYVKHLFAPAPQELKQAIIANTTTNPFKELYPTIYKSGGVNRLVKCPALSAAFQLDNDKTTKEWVITSSISFCLIKQKRGIDSTPHIWVLQQAQNGVYRVLMEGDDELQVLNPLLNPKNGYKDIESDIYLNRTTSENFSECGGATLEWVYQDDLYVLKNTKYHDNDCDTHRSQGEMRKQYFARNLKRIKPLVDALMTGFKTTRIKPVKEINLSSEDLSNKAKHDNNIDSLLDIISLEELHLLLDD